jgi:hypothetical protein
MMNTFSGLDMDVNPMAEIDKIPAGPDLDRFISEKVMGKKITPDMLISLADGRPAHMPHYSINIQSAFEVLHELGKKQWCSSMYQYKNTIASCQLEKRDDVTHLVKTIWSATGDTMPLAICRAALKLVMGATQEK